MDEHESGEDDQVQYSSGTFSFTCKTAADHLRGFFARPIAAIATFAAVFGGFWTIYEATISSIGIAPNRLLPYLGFVTISLGVAILVRGYQYINEIPDGLENVNKSARRIAHLQRPRWEFRFAKSVLAEKLGPIDRECQDLLNGNVFVYARKPTNVQEYVETVSERPTNLINLLGIATRVVIHDFTAAIKSTEDQPASPKSIVESVETIARLYRDTVEMERLTHSIHPPDGLEKLHELQIGWAEPIRSGIHQLFEFLQKICDLEIRKNHTSNLQFTVVFEVPENLEPFMDEMNRLEPLLPQIIARDRGYGV